VSAGTKLFVRPTSNPDAREYHVVGEEICDPRIPYAEFFQPLHGSEKNFSDLGPTGEAIAEALMGASQASTIERIVFRPNSVRVYKTSATGWGMVEETVTSAIMKALDDADLEIIQYGDIRLRQLAHA